MQTWLLALAALAAEPLERAEANGDALPLLRAVAPAW